MKMPACQKPARKGFTLIELLVVVAIIALLISILLPSLSRAREQAKTVKCSAQLHDISVGLMAYNSDYGRFPHQNTIGDVPGRNQREAAGFWTYSVHEELARYMGGLQLNSDADEHTRTHEVFYCPFVAPADMSFDDGRSATDVLCGPGTGNPIEASEEVYLHIAFTYMAGLQECGNDPAASEQILERAGSFVDNPMLSDIKEKRRNYVRKEPDARYVMMADTVMAWEGGNRWRINHGAGWNQPLPRNAAWSAPELDSANVMYGDGHVETKRPGYFRELMDAPSKIDAKKNATLMFGVGVPQPPSAWQGDAIYW